MDVAVYESESHCRVRTAGKHLSMVLRYMPGKGNLLDVGCASGVFLEQALRGGWRIRGVEPNERLAQKAAERLGAAAVVNRALEEAELPCQSFDAVTLWDVLEHVADPAGVLAKCASLLRPEGVVLAKVPDLDSLTARLMRERWPLLLPEHLSYFTKKSLCALSHRAHLYPVTFFRSTVAFSVGYVLHRLSQHRIPSAAVCHRLVKNHAIGKMGLSLPLGELYVVFKAVAGQF
jgi:2-polyprenyl-3-methyl-5-hydroxy-6-metoxy-1,4-benzoquinol methylase